MRYKQDFGCDQPLIDKLTWISTTNQPICGEYHYGVDFFIHSYLMGSSHQWHTSSWTHLDQTSRSTSITRRTTTTTATNNQTLATMTTGTKTARTTLLLYTTVAHLKKCSVKPMVNQFSENLHGLLLYFQFSKLGSNAYINHVGYINNKQLYINSFTTSNQ